MPGLDSTKITAGELVAVASAAATTTVPASGATTTAAAAALRPILTRPGDVDGDVASVDGFAVQGVDRPLSFLRCGHGDKAKAARTAAHAVDHEIGFDDRAVGGKGVLKVVFRGVEGKISHKQFRAHLMIAVEFMPVSTVPDCRVSNHH